MKAIKIVVLSLLAVLLPACRFQDGGTNAQIERWWYYIEAEDGTNCEITYPSTFNLSNDGISVKIFERIDVVSNNGKPYGSFFAHCNYYDKKCLPN